MSTDDFQIFISLHYSIGSSTLFNLSYIQLDNSNTHVAHLLPIRRSKSALLLFEGMSEGVSAGEMVGKGTD